MSTTHASAGGNSPVVPDSVPGKQHYSLDYLLGGRIFSYAHQIDAALRYRPQSILEVGVGTGMVSAALRAAGVHVRTLDLQPELNPDIQGSITSIPIENKAVDVSICCQVLEHLPFDQFALAITELRRVSRAAIILSLPDATPYYELKVRLPGLRPRPWTGTRQREPKRELRERRWKLDGHYWEIGYRETPLRIILSSLEQTQVRMRNTWRVPEKPYHRFFELLP